MKCWIAKCLEPYGMNVFSLKSSFQVSSHFPQVRPGCYPHNRVRLHETLHHVAPHTSASRHLLPGGEREINPSLFASCVSRFYPAWFYSWGRHLENVQLSVKGTVRCLFSFIFCDKTQPPFRTKCTPLFRNRLSRSMANTSKQFLYAWWM